ncbi:muskelin [Hermetia illucens]|nr:muskelin [Hermetia illucens]
MACRLSESQKLQYEICRYSSYSTSYLPDNILENCPDNQASRWSSNTNNPPQFLTLKLKRPAIVHKIMFGKFEKSHVCNLKKFRIYGGLEESRMVLLREGGLQNDSNPETFDLRHVNDNGELLPVMYVQIMPLLSWGPSFNFSIWYVELHGQDDPVYVQESLKGYNTLREIEVIRLCLKHFRQQGYDAAFEALQEQTQVRLEHPVITDLYECLVTSGDFRKTEEFISNCIHDGHSDEYLFQHDYSHTWNTQNMNGDEKPGTRGGHQLVMDSAKGIIYLFGGWNGHRDMNDLWYFDIRKEMWTRLFENSSQFGGPSPRSCHKMVLDPTSGHIFTLGRYLDSSVRKTEYLKSDFYLYDTVTNTWLQICDDTSQVGGPQLVYDHQMCIDVEKRMIYVFGGKILTPRSINQTSTETEYSGLFSYHIATNTWTQIFVDCGHPSASNPDVLSIKSRVTHCMVFHTERRKLYIYGGQRGKEDLNNFISYDVDTQEVTELTSDPYNQNKTEPPVGFTQRATIDSEKDEIYVYFSLSKQKDRRDPQPSHSSNSFWMYSIRTNKWSRIYTCKHPTERCYSKTQEDNHSEPCPRYAHQLVYDDIRKVHYLFGGNPGKSNTPNVRLDDFWRLELTKPNRSELLRHCQFLIRRLHYEEICKVDPIKACKYLQKEVSEVIDHHDKNQLENFHKLASLLFQCDDYEQSAAPMKTLPIRGETHNDYDIGGSGDTYISGKTSIKDNLPMFVTNAAPKTMSDKMIQSNNLSYSLYQKCGGKKSRGDYFFGIKSKRTHLFNTLVQFMPQSMVQPRENLSDFVLF